MLVPWTIYLNKIYLHNILMDDVNAVGSTKNYCRI